MKYGDSSTFSGKQHKKHGATTSPAMSRYFNEKRWLTNALRKKLRQERIERHAS